MSLLSGSLSLGFACCFHKGSGSHVHFRPRPSSSTDRWARLTTDRHLGPHNTVKSVLSCPPRPYRQPSKHAVPGRFPTLDPKKAIISPRRTLSQNCASSSVFSAPPGASMELKNFVSHTQHFVYTLFTHAMEHCRCSKVIRKRNAAVPAPTNYLQEIIGRSAVSVRRTILVLKHWYSLFEQYQRTRFNATEEMLSKISDETFNGGGTFDDFRSDLESALSTTRLTARSDHERVGAVNIMGVAHSV